MGRLCGQRQCVKVTDRNPIWEACGGGSQLPDRCTGKPELWLAGVRGLASVWAGHAQGPQEWLCPAVGGESAREGTGVSGPKAQNAV